MPLIPPAPGPGQVVRLRQRLYLVDEVIDPPETDQATLVRLSCLDDDAQGQALEVLWECEVDAEILSGESWEKLAERGFDPTPMFSAYLHTLRWNCVTATDPKRFQSPFRAGIRLDAYQLEPLRKALLLPRVNLFIADDVGLGKTIEAGLIARELLLRRKVREIVVACPPSMLDQWQDELEARFGLTFVILDRNYIAQVRRERGYGVNPWTTHPRFLVSHRLLIDEGYLGPMRDWLGEFRTGALLILDEAHHAAPASGARYAIDSRITRAVREVAPRFEHRLFLSATPHNGHSNSFSALLEILDPQRFCRGVPVQGAKQLNEIMVRRLKEDLRELQGGFPKREIVQIDIDGLPSDAPELRLAELLDEYRQVREERLAGESKRAQASAGLLVTGLQQRLLSSIEAFARTLRVHRRTMERHWAAAVSSTATAVVARAADVTAADVAPVTGATRVEVRQPALDLLRESVGSDDDRAAFSEEELQAEEDAQVEAATLASAGPASAGMASAAMTSPGMTSAGMAAAQSAAHSAAITKERALLDEMTRIADQARDLPDARVRALVEWIRAEMCPEMGTPGARWNDARVLIFTEYDDTKRYLVAQLATAIRGTDRADRRIAVFHGPTPADERKELKRAFNADPAKNALRILVATDAAREGINLQARCWNLFHFDLPWNPSRIEQRNGRIDRKLQPQPVVYCHYFVYRQRVEDRVLQVLVQKTERIRRELGSLACVLESRLSDTLSGGIRHADEGDLKRRIDEAELDAERQRSVRNELEETRYRQDALIEELDRLREMLSRSQRLIGLDETHFRAAISAGLQLRGSTGLAMVRPANGHPAAYGFPALDTMEAGDPTWADTLDTLREPRGRHEKKWEWRRQSPIRPVVFEDPGTMDDETVHLHLEHRVVQRLLGRFRSQGFVHHDLSRACLAQTRDAVPRVMLLGRLCLYGQGAARLHEELITIAARWTDPRTKRAPLQPYAAATEERTVDLLEEALLAGSGRAVNEVIRRQLQSSAVRDIVELLPHLQERGERLAEENAALLQERARREAAAMREILESQRNRIHATARRYEDPQQSLDFGDDERQQLESNQRHWGKRLRAIEEELQTEPARIESIYEIRARRVEPVGLVYLWPMTG
jgi:superfamily II DNA or RNA helicase